METLLKTEILQPNFDINRYTGTWYEIARLPNPFDLDCANATARYRKIGKDKISILNTCLDIEGNEKRKALGTGTVVFPEYPAALNVQFVDGEQYATNDTNYLVHKTDYNNTAVVGNIPRDGLFLLARTPSISYSKFEELKNFSKGLGYNVDELVIDYNAVNSPPPLEAKHKCKFCTRGH